jgi:hypothetical protein
MTTTTRGRTRPGPAAVSKAKEETGLEAGQAVHVQAARKQRAARATAKTGDPQADRAARDVQASKEQAKATAPKPTHTHEYVLVNGDFRVHKAGCKDMAKDAKLSDYAQPATATWATEEEAVRELWEDIIGDEVDQDKDGPVPVSYLHKHGLVGATDFLPCCKLTPMPTDGEPAKDKAAKASRNGKQALAKAVLDAVAGVVGDTLVREMAGMTEAEAGRVVAQWLHHLNAGQDGEGQRYWPAALPKPERSDWR